MQRLSVVTELSSEDHPPPAIRRTVSSTTAAPSPVLRRLARAWRAAPDPVRDAVRKVQADDLAGEAAKMAYFFFVSLFPALLLMFALSGLVGGDAAFARIASALRAAVPEQAWRFLRGYLLEITEQPRPGLLSIGVLLLLWAASSGIAALMHALNVIYEVPERRGWLARRAIALGVFTAAAFLLVSGAAVLLGGVSILRTAGLIAVWRVARWPLAVLLALAAVWLAYYFLPDRPQRGRERAALAGAALSTVLWGAATLGLGFYVSNIRNYSRLYGAIGAVIVLLVWFYLSALAVLLGGELAATLERRHDERADPST